MPRAFTDSARASRASSSNSRRGWFGLGRISSVGISRRPVSARELVERIAARPRPIPRAAPPLVPPVALVPRPDRAGVPPRPLAVSATCSHLLRELEVGHGARAARVVADHGEAVARGLADADVTGDHGIEDELGEVLSDLALDVLREARSTVVHRQDHAGDRQAWVHLALDERERVEQPGQTLEGEVLGLDRHDHPVGGYEGVHGEWSKGGWAIEDGEEEPFA